MVIYPLFFANNLCSAAVIQGKCMWSITYLFCRDIVIYDLLKALGKRVQSYPEVSDLTQSKYQLGWTALVLFYPSQPVYKDIATILEFCFIVGIQVWKMMSTASWPLWPGTCSQVNIISGCETKHKSKMFWALVGKVTTWIIWVSCDKEMSFSWNLCDT